MYKAFETEVSVVSFDGNLHGTGKATVKWAASIEFAKNGIHCIGLSVLEQVVKTTVKQTVLDLDTGEEIENEAEIEFKMSHENTVINEKDSYGNYNYLKLVPHELEIIANEKCMLKF